MPDQYREFNVKGKTIKVPAYSIGPRLIVVTGKWLKIARIYEEDWHEQPPFENMDAFLSALKKAAPQADLFTFSQDFTEPKQLYSFPFERDDVAAVPVTTFAAWWEALPQESRKNVRKAEKKGVTTKVAVLDNAFIAGIKSIYDETPLRQGRPFWHYGKDLETIKRENSTFPDRSDFIAAYHENELIGFIKLVYVGKCARIMQILSKNAHMDKKTPNILLSKAVEVCAQRGMTHFVYAKYFYGKKGHTPITEFKRRNGFIRIEFPQYFVPLTLKGKTALSLKLHRGLQDILPQKMTNALLDIRARLNGSKTSTKKEPAPEKESKPV